MKTKHPNFKHPMASAPDPTFVPDHLIRKHWSLQLIEMYHIVICIVLLVSVLGTLGESIVVAIFPLFILALFALAVYLSISDDHRFRKVILFAHISLFLFVVIALVIFLMRIEALIIITFMLMQSLFVLATVFLVGKNKRYYEWCKSIASRT